MNAINDFIMSLNVPVTPAYGIGIALFFVVIAGGLVWAFSRGDELTTDQTAMFGVITLFGIVATAYLAAPLAASLIMIAAYVIVAKIDFFVMPQGISLGVQITISYSPTDQRVYRVMRVTPAAA